VLTCNFLSFLSSNFHFAVFAPESLTAGTNIRPHLAILLSSLFLSSALAVNGGNDTSWSGLSGAVDVVDLVIDNALRSGLT